MHFSFPVPTNQTSVSSPSLALDPTHPIITSLQETLNYKLNYPIARIRESKNATNNNTRCSSWADLWFFARTHNAEVRFEYPRWFMYDPLDWGWSKFSMLVSKNRNLSSPSPPRILGHFFSSLDSQGNLRYGFGSNENLPRLTQTAVRYPSSSSASTIPAVNNSSFQFRFNRRQQPYLDTIEYRRNANSGLLLNVSCKIDPHSHQRNSSSSSSSSGRPAFLSRFGIGYALTPTSGSMSSTKMMKNLTNVRASIEYYSQFPQNFIEGEQSIHHHHRRSSPSTSTFTIPERRKGYSYVLMSSSIAWEKNRMIGINRNQKKCINFFLDGGAWLNTHGPAGSLFFSSLTLVVENDKNNNNKQQPLSSVHQSHFYDRYRNSSTVLNVQHNSDSGMTMSAVVPFSFNENGNENTSDDNNNQNQQNKMIRLGSFWTIPITENQKERNKRGIKVVVELESPLELMRHFWRKLLFVTGENNNGTNTSRKSGIVFDNTSTDGEEGKVSGELRRGTCLTFAAEVSPLNSRPRYGMHFRG